jgi:hypothetical protein
MSSMLEQAIVDAQALREAALKNAEQALIEKFAPQIKDAVESLLEGEHAPAKKQAAYEGQVYSVMEVENGQATIQREGQKPFIVAESELSEVTENLLQEEEGMASGGAAPAAAIEAPFAGSPVSDPSQTVEFSMDVEEPVYEFDLEALKNDFESEEMEDIAMDGPSDLLGDLGDEEAPEDAAAEEGEDDLLSGLDLQESVEEDDLVNEILNLMNEIDNDEEEVLEEELIVDMGQRKTGYNETFEPTLQYEMELEKAHMESTQYKEENEDLKKDNEKLQETLKKFTHKNKQYKDAVEKLSNKLNETFLSNAKLLYSNRTLSDASLNERQKNKIVEAIAKARTPEEAKNLCETLNATVNSGSETKSPRTLSESVQRKSNLSGILPRRNKQANESESHTFADHMKKLAGIK